MFEGRVREKETEIMLTKTLTLLLPPIATKSVSYAISYRKRRHIKHPQTLFDGDDSCFKSEIKHAKIYGEYGCGKSTSWVIRNTDCKVIAVDTSPAWIGSVRNAHLGHEDRLDIHHADLGEVGAWGRPVGYQRNAVFPEYTDFLWTRANMPDLVLIDGRFRVCCFLTSLKFADPGTKIIFDDYTIRPHYHFIEKYTPRIRECGRQCLFIVPSKSTLDMHALDRDINSFRFVME